LSDEVLVWLYMSWAKCKWSNWCHYHPVFLYCVKIQDGFSFPVPAYPGCSGKRGP